MPKAKSKREHGTLPIEPIPFVRSSADSSSHATSKSSRRLTATNLDGKDVRTFYESVVQLHEDESSGEKQRKKQSEEKKKKVRAATSNQKQRPKAPNQNVKEEANHRHVNSDETDFFRLRNCLFSAAEKGDTSEIGYLLQCGANVNCQDQYGWTALMCAAQSGKSKAITFLLDSGGDASIRNAKGLSAWDLADKAKHHKVIQAITHHGKEESSVVYVRSNPAGESESFWCNDCNETVEGSSREKHQASTVHQLNTAPPVNDTAYAIPGHNRGFQLMLKSGWDQDKGLGPSGCGQKYPIKTHLKRDRKGLGVEEKKSKPRVTHFQPFEKKAIEHKHRQERLATLSKRAASKKEKKDKERERQFRMEWNSID